MAGLAPWAGIGPYNGTKYAVVGISETLAIELDGTGVGVSVLCPGVVNTNIFTSQRNRPDHLRNDEPNPLARSANAELGAADRHRLRQSWPTASPTRSAPAQFWIITHPELLDVVETRHARLLEQGRH